MSVTCSVLTLVIASGVLVGWQARSTVLTALAVGLVAMNPLTAVCFLLCGTALLLRVAAAQELVDRLAAAIGACVAVFGLLRIVGYVTAWDAHVDGVLFASRLSMGGGVPNRMAPNTAFNFCLIGIAIAGGAHRLRRSYQYFVLLAALTSFVALMGYAYSLSSLVRVGTQTPMALHTAVLFLAVAAAALCVVPERGLVAALTSATPGGRVIRRMLPALVAGPPVFGWLRLEGELAGLYSASFGVALIVGAMVAMGVGLTLITARAVDLTEAERRRAEEITIRLAHFDQLTGLANRTLFDDRLRQALARAKRNNGLVAVLFLDLDGFKRVNDLLGHEAGDHVLKEVARRIRGALRATDTAARLGGDEFTAVLEQVHGEEDVQLVVRRLLTLLSAPYDVAGTQAILSASVGVSAYPTDALQPEELLSLADAAMYRAKHAGKNRAAFHRSGSRPLLADEPPA